MEVGGSDIETSVIKGCQAHVQQKLRRRFWLLELRDKARIIQQVLRQRLMVARSDVEIAAEDLQFIPNAGTVNPDQSLVPLG